MPDRLADDAARTISPDEAASRLGLQRSTLDTWRWEGKGPPHIRVGSKIRYRLGDIAGWLDQRTRTSTADRRADG